MTTKTTASIQVNDAIETSRREDRTVLIPTTPEDWQDVEDAVFTADGYEDSATLEDGAIDAYGADWRVCITPKS